MDKAFEKAVFAFLKEKELICTGNRVIVAASGGADSMALLQFFLLHGQALGIKLEAVHVDHRLRQDSGRVAEDVKKFCEQRGIAYRCFVADAPIGPRSEDWSRQLRYGFFETLIEPNVRIATAHTLSDQAETLLFRLARGTGVKGAGGIPAKRGAYIRPMLTVTKAMAEGYCTAHGIDYFCDPDNYSHDYARTGIRHTALPALEASLPNTQQQLGRFCERMQTTQQYLQHRGEQLLQAARTKGGYSLECLQAAHPIEQEQALRLLVQRERPLREGDLAALSALVQQGEGAVQLAPDAVLTAQKGCLQWRRLAPAQTPLPPQPLLPQKYSLPGGFCIDVTLLEGVECEESIKFAQKGKKVLNNCADYDKINGSLCLRTRNPGDTHRLAGRGVSKTLKKLYNELGIPTAQRSLLPLVAVGSRVVWLWGLGFEEGLAPTPNTKRLLCIREQSANTILEDNS